MSNLGPLVCVRCADRGRTCCALSGGNEEFCFPVSASERLAILASGIGAEAFVSAPNTQAFVEQLDQLIPDHAVKDIFPANGSHWRLATTTGGQCILLGGAGCGLERSIRPFYCRLFPLWVYRGQLTWFTAEECLANEQCNSIADMLRFMDAEAREIRSLFRAMCHALGLGNSKVI